MKIAVAALGLTFLAAPALAAPTHHVLGRADGSVVHYSLDWPEGAPQGIVLLAQGSGCGPAAQSPNLATVREAFPHHLALTIEKSAITPDAAIVDGFTDCPAAFHESHTVSGRVADMRMVLDHLAANPDLPDRLVLFGGSEGGLAISMLLDHVEADAAILLSSGAGIPFGEMILSTVPPEGQQTVAARFAAARADPEGAAIFAGSSHRFWADALDRNPLDHLLATRTPVLVLQGGRDVSSPLDAARATTAAFAAQGLCHLTYWEFPALDHGMADPAGRSHLATIAHLAAAWSETPVSC